MTAVPPLPLEIWQCILAYVPFSHVRKLRELSSAFFWYYMQEQWLTIQFSGINPDWKSIRRLQRYVTDFKNLFHRTMSKH
jgi:hypothetical protein